ncbi:hypothetical protein EB796_024906 [Bugula neritina]|uniref:Uncharacterized protein n=1 Tax=Bugula neritina TaxID=10212 RepID=A0A7J7IS55_BUGNE|nr:hypothetical protein EB796_024906 [Bugula neritina]
MQLKISEQGEPWLEEDLQIACALKTALWQQSEATLSPSHCILAELKEKQIFELSNLTYTFSDKKTNNVESKSCVLLVLQNEEELQVLKTEFQMEYLTCVYKALTDTSHFVKKVVEQMADALENTFDNLKDKLILEALFQQVGEAEWSRLSEEERQRRLLDIKFKERQLRKEGRIDEANNLIHEHLKNTEVVMKLKLISNLEFERLMKERLERKTKRIAEGMSEEEAKTLEESERQRDEAEILAKSQDPLKMLEDWWKPNVDGIMSDLDAHLEGEERTRREQEKLAKIRRDQRRIKQEANYSAAATLMKLLQDQNRTAEEMRQLQEQLAKERLLAKRNRLNEVVVEKSPTSADTDDVIVLRETVLQELDLKHLEERELLLRLADHAPNTDLFSTSAQTNEVNQKMVLMDLMERGDNSGKELRLPNQSSRRCYRLNIKFSIRYIIFVSTLDKKMIYLIENLEGICYKWHIKGRSYEEEGVSCTQEDIVVSLLADLQQLQTHEANNLSKDIQPKAALSLREILSLQQKARANGWHDNVAAVILTTDNMADSGDPQQEVLNAVTQKYDALRDKLILEGLFNQVGEAEWSALNEKEKQQNY